MTSVNILHSVQSLIAEPISEQVPVFLNEPRAIVDAATDKALPNLIGAILHRASTAEGCDLVLRLLHMSSVDTALLSSNLDGVFAGGPITQGLIDTGLSHLQALFGSRIQHFNESLAAIVGIGEKGAATLTAMLTPFVLAAIKQAATVNGHLNASNLGSAITPQKKHVIGRMSERLLEALGLGTLAAWVTTERDTVKARMHEATATRKTTVPAGSIVAEKRKSSPLKWLALLALALLALLLLGYCMKQSPDSSKAMDPVASSSTATQAASPETASNSAASSTAAAMADAASEVSSAIPKGAGIIAAMLEGRPSLKVYFDYGKSEVAPDFADKAKDVLAYLKSNPSAKASVSGFTDSSGDATLNAELAMKRAESAKAALVAAGVDQSRISLDKPDTVSGDTSDAKDRRVEIRITQ
ncbi:DUF937 domain-containing protein [Paraburkholderia sp. BR14263]|uniref:DUF937 domain-containing protein n=1 Tax=unclassified Paraburkholderia TaxID=2615204 RepID=UPI0034CDBAB3